MLADWFLYECAKCGMKCVKGREGGRLACRQEPCSASTSGEDVTVVALVPDGKPQSMAALLAMTSHVGVPV